MLKKGNPGNDRNDSEHTNKQQAIKREVEKKAFFKIHFMSTNIFSKLMWTGITTTMVGR